LAAGYYSFIARTMLSSATLIHRGDKLLYNRVYRITGLLTLLLSWTNLPVLAQSVSTLWYDGAPAGGAALNQVQPAPGFTQACFEEFVVTDPAGWHVTGLFVAERYSSGPYGVRYATDAEWSIRQGMRGVPFSDALYAASDRGDAGTIVAGGKAPLSYMPANLRYTSGFSENFTVTALDVDLSPGVYWMEIAPIVPPPPDMDNYSFPNGVAPSSVGWEAIGEPDAQGVIAYLPLVFPAQDFVYLSTPWRLSMGVLGSVGSTGGPIGGAAVPEPGLTALLGALAVPVLLLLVPGKKRR
jgi:hypothetical protein